MSGTYDWEHYEYRVVGVVNIKGEDRIVAGHTWQCVWGQDPELTLQSVRTHLDLIPTKREDAPLKGEWLVIQRRPVGKWEDT